MDGTLSQRHMWRGYKERELLYKPVKLVEWEAYSAVGPQHYQCIIVSSHGLFTTSGQENVHYNYMKHLRLGHFQFELVVVADHPQITS